MNTKEEYTRRLEERLKTWDAKLDALKAQAAESGEDMKQRFETQRAHLARLREDTRIALTQLSERGESAWDDIRTRTEASWDKMTESLEKLADRFGRHK